MFLNHKDNQPRRHNPNNNMPDANETYRQPEHEGGNSNECGHSGNVGHIIQEVEASQSDRW